MKLREPAAAGDQLVVRDRTRRSRRARAPRRDRPCGWWRAGGRSRSRSGSRAAAPEPARSVPLCCMSTLAVASSRIRIRGSATRARAKATSWRWPEDSWTPRSPTWLSQPVSRCLDHRVEANGVPAWIASSRDASGFPNAMLSAIVPAEEERPPGARCPSASAATGTRHPAQVVAVDPNGAGRLGRRSAPRAWQACTCRLPSRPPALPSVPGSILRSTSSSASPRLAGLRE